MTGEVTSLTVLTHREIVTIERKRRALSVRGVSVLAGISNQTWGQFEKGETSLTPTVQYGVAKAFGWPTDWPESKLPDYVAPSDINEVANLKERVARLEVALEALGERTVKTDARARKTSPRPRHPVDPNPPA